MNEKEEQLKRALQELNLAGARVYNSARGTKPFRASKLLTANTSAFHRTGKECSLSDILEKEIPDKYFLSEKLLSYLLERQKVNPKAGKHLLSKPVTEKLKA